MNIYKTHIGTYILLITVFSCLSFSGSAQDIRIVIEDGTIVPDSEVSVSFFENKKDTLQLIAQQPGYYHFEKRKDKVSLIVSYKLVVYTLPDIENSTKCIYICYQPDAEKDCYVINEIYYDTIQTRHMGKIKDCSDITNVNLYDEFAPGGNPIRIRAKN